MGQISLNIPQIGLSDTTEDVKVANNFSAIQAAVNGNLDSTNLTAATAQAASVNQSGQTVKGSAVIGTAQSTSSTSYTTLSTPDQVTGLVLGANGLIFVSYLAIWNTTVANAGGQAAVFLNSVQLQNSPAGTPVNQAAITTAPAGSGQYLFTGGNGLGNDGNVVSAGPPSTGFVMEGTPITIIAAAGTYTVSVRFKASAGDTVTVSTRRLYVEARNYA